MLSSTWQPVCQGVTGRPRSESHLTEGAASMGERATGVFSDIHCEDGKVRVTLLHDPTVEGLDTAIYVDGSGSMEDEYGRPSSQKARRARPSGTEAAPQSLSKKFWHWLTGKEPEPPRQVAQSTPPPAPPELVNVVAPQIKRMLQWLPRTAIPSSGWLTGHAPPTTRSR